MVKIENSAILRVSNVFRKVFIFDIIPMFRDKQAYIDKLKDSKYPHSQSLVKFLESRQRKNLPYLPDKALLLADFDSLSQEDARRLVDDLRMLVVNNWKMREQVQR
jgi:hypothetical protein